MIAAILTACVALGCLSTNDGLDIRIASDSCEMPGYGLLVRDEGCVTLGGPPRCRVWRLHVDGTCAEEPFQCSVYPGPEVCFFGHCVIGSFAYPQIAWWADLADPVVPGEMTVGIWSPP